MIEKYGDLLKDHADAYGVTTNGFVKNNGEAVMGRGIAKQLKDRFPDLPMALGAAIQTYGNTPTVFEQFTLEPIISIPVKKTKEIVLSDRSNVVRHCKVASGRFCPGFWLRADIDVIKQSIRRLIDIVNANGYQRVNIPRVGCGAGELDYGMTIRPMLMELDDRFYVYDFKR